MTLGVVPSLTFGASIATRPWLPGLPTQAEHWCIVLVSSEHQAYFEKIDDLKNTQLKMTGNYA